MADCSRAPRGGASRSLLSGLLYRASVLTNRGIRPLNTDDLYFETRASFKLTPRAGRNPNVLSSIEQNAPRPQGDANPSNRATGRPADESEKQSGTSRRRVKPTRQRILGRRRRSRQPDDGPRHGRARWAPRRRSRLSRGLRSNERRRRARTGRQNGMGKPGRAPLVSHRSRNNGYTFGPLALTRSICPRHFIDPASLVKPAPLSVLVRCCAKGYATAKGG